MENTTNTPYQPNDLAFYTTWWLAPTSSLSSQQSILSDSGERFLLDKSRQKQV